MRLFVFWVSILSALLRFGTVSGAQEASFEIRYTRPSHRINSIKAWADRVCAIDYEDYQLRCFDRAGSVQFDLDVRDRLMGGISPLTRIVDYSILDDGGVVVVGYWLGPATTAPNDRVAPYLLVLDRRGERTALHELGDLDLAAVGGANAESLEALALGPEFALPCDPSSGLSCRQSGMPPGPLLHSISPTGEVFNGRLLFDVPTAPEELDQLRTALSKGIAIDGAGNRFFWVSDDEIVVATAVGERRSVFVPHNPGLFRTPLRLLSRHDTGALAIFLEGVNEAPPKAAALGMFVLKDSQLRVYTIDPAGQATELPVSGVTNLVGELSDGTLVGLQGVGRGRSGVVFLDSVAELERQVGKHSKRVANPRN